MVLYFSHGYGYTTNLDIAEKYSSIYNCDAVAETSKTFILQPQLQLETVI